MGRRPGCRLFVERAPPPAFADNPQNPAFDRYAPTFPHDEFRDMDGQTPTFGRTDATKSQPLYALRL